MKTTVIFKDAKGNKVVFNAEITERNGYPEFTASGEYCGSMGQCFDNVEPATESQAKLIELWHKWHLNGMKPGCEHQRAEKWEDIRINPSELPNTHANRDEGGILASWVSPSEHPDGLLTKPCPVCGYKYGTAWLRDDLPGDFEDTLTDLIETIEQEEEEKAERPITAEDIDLFDNFSEPETALALALICGLSVNEIDDISEDGNNYWTVQGVSYLAGTDDEMDVLWDEELDRYIDECIEIPAHIEPYFDRERWKDDAKIDGRGHSLNRYDGGEDYAEVNGTTYYAYRQ